jgi:hypothetical protein
MASASVMYKFEFACTTNLSTKLSYFFVFGVQVQVISDLDLFSTYYVAKLVGLTNTYLLFYLFFKLDNRHFVSDILDTALYMYNSLVYLESIS